MQDLDSDALRRELVKDHIEALKRRRADEEKRQKEAAVASFRALLERSSLKASSSWRKVQTRIQDTEEYEVRVGVGGVFRGRGVGVRVGGLSHVAKEVGAVCGGSWGGPPTS